MSGPVITDYIQFILLPLCTIYGTFYSYSYIRSDRFSHYRVIVHVMIFKVIHFTTAKHVYYSKNLGYLQYHSNLAKKSAKMSSYPK